MVKNNNQIHFKSQVIISSDRFEIVSSFNYKNMSIKGIFLKTDKKIAVAIPCECEIRVLIEGSSSTLSLQLKGRIIDQTVSGIEILFEDVDADAYFHLKNLLMYSSSHHDLTK
jgi:hypothetical protein